MTDALYILVGLVALALGGDALVRGAVAIALKLGVSPFVVGVVLVGFGTSTPELVTSLNAAFAGSPGVAFGNVVGSNIANILLIVGLAALVRPMTAPRAALGRDAVALMIATVVGVVLLHHALLARVEGGLLLAGLAAYLALTIILDARGKEPAALHAHEAETASAEKMGAVKAALFAVAGLAGVLVGARLLVDGAIGAAEAFGVSDAVIGLTVVAVGTSLPELAAALAAARRNQGDVALGNIVGSNIFNLLGILGATALVHPLKVPPGMAAVDGWVMLASALTLVVVMWTGRRVGRVEGGLLLAAYLVYVGGLAGGIWTP